MIRKILHYAGAIFGLLLLFIFVLPALFKADSQSAPVVMAENALYKKVATGFYAVDALTQQPVPFAKIIIRLKYDDDPEEKRLVTVAMQSAYSNGWTPFRGLEPNITVVDTPDEGKSNSYVVFACDNVKPFAKRYGRLNPLVLSEPGLYDSTTIELEPISADEEHNC